MAGLTYTKNIGAAQEPKSNYSHVFIIKIASIKNLSKALQNTTLVIVDNQCYLLMMKCIYRYIYIYI